MRLQKEYEAVGFFLSGHPLDEYDELLKRLRVQTWADFCRAAKNGAAAGRVAATVLDRTERRMLLVLHGRTSSVRYALIRTSRDWLLHRTRQQG